MKNQNHVIKKQILDFTLDSEVGSFTFQSKLSEIFKTAILPRIDAHCTRLSDSSEILRLDRLEVDLGVLEKRNWVKEFKEKIDEVFPQKLSAVLSGQQLVGDTLTRTLMDKDFAPQKTGVITRQDRDFELLAHFIKEGRLPWWVKRNEFPEITRLLAEMVSKEPVKMRALLNEIADDLASVQRLLYNAEKATLKKLIALFQSRQTVAVYNNLSQTLIEVLLRSPFFSGFSPARVETEVWLVLLSQLFSSSRRSVEPSSIVEKVVKHLAKKFGYDDNALYSYLAEEKKGRTGILRNKISLPQPRGDDKGLTETTDQSWARRVADQTDAYWQQLEKLARLLKEFELIIAKEQRFLALSLGDELTVVLKQTGKAIQEMKALLLSLQEKVAQEKAAREKVPRERITQKKVAQKRIGRTQVLSLTELELGEEQKQKVEEFTELCEDLYLALEDVRRQKEVKMASKVLAKAEEIVATIDALGKKAHALSESASVTASATEEIFLRNAGLVLLWPYLPGFFERTGLVKEQQFVSEEAQERAVLLLHYLTFGFENGQEYEMTLNKILCGLELSKPVNPCLPKFSAEELREGENLLQAVIYNWPALKKMSVMALQSMFLRREGMLFTRDGQWVLKVKEETYDLLLDQMPWGIGTVRLPWMEQLLIVEWRM